jgi:hypothetical protein
MAYSSDITKTLTLQIRKFVTLNRHQLAGQVANLDFWVGKRLRHGASHELTSLPNCLAHGGCCHSRA